MISPTTDPSFITIGFLHQTEYSRFSFPNDCSIEAILLELVRYSIDEEATRESLMNYCLVRVSEPQKPLSLQQYLRDGDHVMGMFSGSGSGSVVKIQAKEESSRLVRPIVEMPEDVQEEQRMRYLFMNYYA